MGIITLITDFGSRDGYVGAMKGVIARVAPDCTVVDIAHDLPRGDIAHAAWVVRTSTLEFPAGTVHVVVVDPGVGGARPCVIAQVDSVNGVQTYVGPDNGVFGYLTVREVSLIRTSVLTTISPTFHGRDVFAPTAAALVRGLRSVIGDITTLKGQLPWLGGGHVVHIDHYGNLISDLEPTSPPATQLRIAGQVLPIVRTYEDVSPGDLLAYVGSAGTLEVAVRDGRADARLGVTRGEPIMFADEGPYR